ncbi:MAG: sterol carrier protein [Nitrososphaerota archaeon]
MAKFPSQEWADLYMKAINSNPAYEQAARDWEGDFLFVITPDERFKGEAVLYLDLYHGKCRQARLLASRAERGAAFTLEGPFSSWLDLLQGRLDPIQAVISGRLRLQGDMMKVMRYIQAATELVRTAQRVPTEY